VVAKWTLASFLYLSFDFLLFLWRW